MLSALEAPSLITNGHRYQRDQRLHLASRPRQAMPTHQHRKSPEHVQTAWPLTGRRLA
jgi:hypothetical protein